MRVPPALLPFLPLLLLPAAAVVAAAPGGGGGGKSENESDRTVVSQKLFGELEEAARLADVAYCVGVSGIWRPFGCLSWCGEFEGVELVDVWIISRFLTPHPFPFPFLPSPSLILATQTAPQQQRQ